MYINVFHFTTIKIKYQTEKMPAPRENYPVPDPSRFLDPEPDRPPNKAKYGLWPYFFFFRVARSSLVQGSPTVGDALSSPLVQTQLWLTCLGFLSWSKLPHQPKQLKWVAVMVNIIQILTAMRGTVKIIGPRWCQNHDNAWREAEGKVMVLISPRVYHFKLCPE